MNCQVDKNEHYRHYLLFAFNRGAKAAEAAREICAVYGQDAMTVRTAQYWFAKFKNGNFDLKDAHRSGRPTGFDEDKLNALLNENGRQTCRKLAEQMKCDPKTILNHMKSMDKVQKLSASLSHI